MAFMNNVTIMNSGAALSLGATGSTVDVYGGEPGNPSGGVVLDKVLGYGIQAVWTGTNTPAGNFTVESSNDNTNWTTITGSTVAAGGAAGNTLWKDFTPGYKYVRVTYTRTSGGASATATFKMYKLTRHGL